jgi:hypothetical protein
VEDLVLVDYLDRETDTARRLHFDRAIIPRATACETAMWQPFDQGRTIGKSGSEMGIILLDEENVDGARIHSRTPQVRHKAGAQQHIRAIPLKSDPNRDAKMNATIQMINEFVEQYP